MSTVKQYLTDLGGIVAVANELSLPVSTVSGWGLNNSVPKWRQDGLRALGERLGKACPDEFAAIEEISPNDASSGNERTA